jgi:hypothetical protein
MYPIHPLPATTQACATHHVVLVCQHKPGRYLFSEMQRCSVGQTSHYQAGQRHQALAMTKPWWRNRCADDSYPQSPCRQSQMLVPISQKRCYGSLRSVGAVSTSAAGLPSSFDSGVVAARCQKTRQLRRLLTHNKLCQGCVETYDWFSFTVEMEERCFLSWHLINEERRRTAQRFVTSDWGRGPLSSLD